ncbi:MAG: histidine kinase dimerization/phosphoacceptor domain -containing protein [Ferruginibacter sp.]
MVKRVIYLCALVLMGLSSVSQPADENSARDLLLRLQQSKPDSNRLKILVQLSGFYKEDIRPGENDTDRACFYAQEAIKLSNTLHDVKWRHEALHCLGDYYFLKGNSAQGKMCYTKIIDDLVASEDYSGQVKWFKMLEEKILINDSSHITKLDCFTRLVFLYRKLNNKDERIMASLHIVRLHLMQGQWTVGEKEALAILDEDKPLSPICLVYAYYYLSEINRYDGNYNKSLHYSLEGINNAEKKDESTIIDYQYGQLAQVYEDLGQLDKSIEYYKKSLSIRKKNKVKTYFIYRTEGFLIQLLLKQNRYNEARMFLNDLSAEKPMRAYDSAILFQIHANYYKVVKQYDLAGNYYQKMISSKGFIDYGDEITSIAYQDVGTFYMDRGNYHYAKEYLSKALNNNGGGTTLIRIKDIQLLLYKVDSASGNYLSAIEHLNKYQQIKDSIFSEVKTRQIEEIQIQYQTAKKEKEILLLNNKNREQQNTLRSNAKTRNLIIAGILILLVFVYYRYYLKQKSNKKLAAQQKEISQKNISLQRLVEEKEWLVKEIHHRVKNNLQIMTSLMNIQSNSLEKGVALDAIKASQRRMNAMSLIHQKLYQSSSLVSINMPKYISELCAYLMEGFGEDKKISIKIDVEDVEFDVSQAVPIGLILNEAVTNSVKYAFDNNKNNCIKVLLKPQSDDKWTLSIFDNGKGLPPGFNFKKSNSIGITLVETLTEQLGGILHFKNENGLKISITFIKSVPGKKPENPEC